MKLIKDIVPLSESIKFKKFLKDNFKSVNTQNGYEETIKGTNISFIKPIIYSVDEMTILYYGSDDYLENNYYIPKLKQEFNEKEIIKYLKGI